ncbi:hypothetical protein ABZ319_24245 [Nocardia sp. NPDC005978]|uniref:hypothetical protein n=1 Tax=Nocardia sp. NPDC005978 TaxID=3156725 RepID=UPI0033A4D3D7
MRTRIGLGGRAGWAGLVAGLCLLGVLEAAVLHFLAAALLPETVALVVDIVAVAATAALLLAVASPLWSHTRLTPTTVHARFGLLAAIDIPRTAITGITSVHTTPAQPAELGLAFDEDSGALSFIRSPASPVLRIDFAAPLPARTAGLRRVHATALLVSTSDSGALLAAEPR